MVAIFLAPISADIKISDKNLVVGLETREALAAGTAELELGCTSLTSISLTACVSQVFYIIWATSAIIARFAGHFLDFFVYYATNSSSYDNTFVKQAWGAVRDVANIFFIVALLYVAIKTILGLNVTDNKKLIGAVIVVALIINFSLFTTKVVIDGSNMLAKVFYNNITSVDASDRVSSAGAEGQKSISIGIIDKFDPQELVTQPSYDANPYTFIFIVLLLIVVTLYTSYIFFSVALLFVARVISLWLSMIFSPLSFASYTVPFDVPGFGHKEWWNDLLKNAFLAPLFIFFLYIIILFTGFLKDIISYTDNTNLTTMENLMQHLMSVVIPFVIIVMLLSKAKALAVKYSGEMGAAINKFGAMAGGLALGAATGGAAFAGKVALGGGGGYLAGQMAKGAETLGLKRTATKLRDVGDFARKSSFDLRGVKFAGQSLGSITGMKVGEAQKGGWAEMKKQQVEKRQKRADELEKRGTGTEKTAVADAEIKLKEATLPVKLDLEKANKEIDKARIDLNDAKNGGNPIEIAAAKAVLDTKKAAKDTIRTNAGLKQLEEAVHQAKQKLEEKSDEVTTAYAKEISGNLSKGLNQIFRLGAYSRAGADEAARKIRTGTKLDSGEKPH